MRSVRRHTGHRTTLFSLEPHPEEGHETSPPSVLSHSSVAHLLRPRAGSEGAQPSLVLKECFGTVVSVSLQHGVPLKVLCDKLVVSAERGGRVADLSFEGSSSVSQCEGSASARQGPRGERGGCKRAGQ